MGKWFRAVDLDLLPNVPIAVEVVAIEKPDSTKCLVDGASFQFSLLLKVDEEVENLGWSDPGCGVVRIEEIELPDPPEIIRFRLLAEIFEMDSADEILVP